MYPDWTSVKQQWPREAVGIMTIVAAALDAEPTIVIYPSDIVPSPWFCFDVGDRAFGIWRETLALYEADEHGAMGDEPLDPVQP